MNHFPSTFSTLRLSYNLKYKHTLLVLVVFITLIIIILILTNAAIALDLIDLITYNIYHLTIY